MHSLRRYGNSVWELLFVDAREYLFETFEAHGSNSKWNKNDNTVMTCKQVTKGLWLATSYIAPINNKKQMQWEHN